MKIAPHDFFEEKSLSGLGETGPPGRLVLFHMAAKGPDQTHCWDVNGTGKPVGPSGPGMLHRLRLPNFWDQLHPFTRLADD